MPSFPRLAEMPNAVRKGMSSALHLYGKYRIVSNGYWFVDVPRTSSSSIRTDLYKHGGVVYRKHNIWGRKGWTLQIFPDHVPAVNMRKFIGEEAWGNLFTFAMVRNPWARLASMYHWRLKVQSIPADVSFQDYVRGLDAHRRGGSGRWFNNPAHSLGAADFVLDERENLIVDYVGRLENREESLAIVRERIGFPELGRTLVQDASPSTVGYVDLYDTDTRNLVADIYCKDIALFGYEFGN
ncbi:MAG: sulfotransferase family 2 domain-containing protein [Alphaproteobacteria bacterium]